MSKMHSLRGGLDTFFETFFIILGVEKLTLIFSNYVFERSGTTHLIELVVLIKMR